VFIAWRAPLPNATLRGASALLRSALYPMAVLADADVKLSIVPWPNPVFCPPVPVRLPLAFPMKVLEFVSSTENCTVDPEPVNAVDDPARDVESNVTVDPVADPELPSSVVIPPPPPEASIVIDPAALVIVIFVPAVSVAKTGSAPVEPIGICPSAATPREVRLLVELPSCRAWLVVPDTLRVTVAPLAAVVILCPPASVTVVPVAAPVSPSSVTMPWLTKDPIVIVPAPLDIEIPVPAVSVPNTGSLLVEPIGSCPLVAAGRALTAPAASPLRSPCIVKVLAPVPPLVTIRGVVEFALITLFVAIYLLDYVKRANS
jgi:hypothetical protein